MTLFGKRKIQSYRGSFIFHSIAASCSTRLGVERKEPSVYSRVNLPHNSVGRTNGSSRKHWRKAIKESRIFVVRDRIRTSLLTRLYGRCFTLPAFHFQAPRRERHFVGPNELFFRDHRRGNSRINERVAEKYSYRNTYSLLARCNIFYTKTLRENSPRNILVRRASSLGIIFRGKVEKNGK